MDEVLDDETVGTEGCTVFSMNDTQAAAFDLLTDYGLPAALDALAFACRTRAGWHRAGRELKYAAKFEGIADKLHRLSLDVAAADAGEPSA